MLATCTKRHQSNCELTAVVCALSKQDIQCRLQGVWMSGLTYPLPSCKTFTENWSPFGIGSLENAIGSPGLTKEPVQPLATLFPSLSTTSSPHLWWNCSNTGTFSPSVWEAILIWGINYDLYPGPSKAARMPRRKGATGRILSCT